MTIVVAMALRLPQSSCKRSPLLLWILLLSGFLLAQSLVGAAAAAPSSEDDPSRSVIVRNESGRRVEINWVEPDTGERVRMSDPDVLTGAEMQLNSFVSHTFEVKEVPKKKTGTCETPDECLAAFFSVSTNQDQIVTVDSNFTATLEDHKSRALKQAGDLIDDCSVVAKESLASGVNETTVLEQFSSCVGAQVERRLERAADEVTFQAQVRKEMGKLYEKYTCFDDELESTTSDVVDEWKDRNGVERTVQILLDRPASKIHLIENFISDDECQAMEDAASMQLQRAVVSDNAGGTTFSESRKAMQAGITVRWDLEEKGDHIAQISRRVYDYANDVLGLDIDEHGQEDLMSIQYFGKGEGLPREEYDQYTPHCDGECTGDPHRTGGRVATMVVYCTVPQKGGATNFANSGVHVHPTKGNGIFFSYIDPETNLMDSGFTEHSGCPVIQGEKKIVTQWIRLGVDDEHPWDYYDTLGLARDDEDEQASAVDEAGAEEEQVSTAGEAQQEEGEEVSSADEPEKVKDEL